MPSTEEFLNQYNPTADAFLSKYVWQSSRSAPQNDGRFLANDPNYDYLNILPFRKNIQTGELAKVESGPYAGFPDLNVPEMLRSPIRGMQDMETAAQNQSTEQTPDSINAMAAMLLPVATEGYVGKKPEMDIGVLADLLKSNSTGSPDTLPTQLPASSFKPQEYQGAINKTYEQAKASRKPFYDYMKESANGQTIDVSPAIGPTEKIIAEIKSDPFHSARPALSKLEDFVETHKENPSMHLADAVEMKQDINSFFNAKKFDQGSKSPYFQVGNVLDSQIDAAAKANPVFGKAKALADENHVNNYALPFTQNKLLETAWKPQDYYAAKSMENGPANYLPDETARRGSEIIGNIKDPFQLDAVTRVLPDEMAEALRQAVLKNTKSGGGSYRLEQLGNMIGTPLSSPKYLFKAIKGQTYNDAQKALISAAKKPSPRLNTEQLAQELMKLRAGGV